MILILSLILIYDNLQNLLLDYVADRLVVALLEGLT